jgi:hypothetical protein
MGRDRRFNRDDEDHGDERRRGDQERELGRGLKMRERAWRLRETEGLDDGAERTER